MKLKETQRACLRMRSWWMRLMTSFPSRSNLLLVYTKSFGVARSRWILQNRPFLPHCVGSNTLSTPCEVSVELLVVLGGLLSSLVKANGRSSLAKAMFWSACCSSFLSLFHLPPVFLIFVPQLCTNCAPYCTKGNVRKQFWTETYQLCEANLFWLALWMLN